MSHLLAQASIIESRSSPPQTTSVHSISKSLCLNGGHNELQESALTASCPRMYPKTNLHSRHVGLPAVYPVHICASNLLKARDSSSLPNDGRKKAALQAQTSYRQSDGRTQMSGIRCRSGVVPVQPSCVLGDERVDEQQTPHRIIEPAHPAKECDF